jgi:lipopolysaccharide transport system ATP-binding protein
MNQIAIEIENVSKEYRLGIINHGMLYKDLQSWWARLTGKEDPNSIIMSNDISIKQIDKQGRFWALQEISFKVHKGDLIGIIGRNGAGKSTLLKIISKITSPTSGTIKINGRISSLLEVGTGFHPELSGRDNVFLNGAILGMKKSEIQKKFDEIVDFSEIGKFIDTPVKRYSSGMYVRLAFAVAAHLQPEILLLDEVLAVGDARFQKKCLGKMEEVSKNDGRTILFVSHNMTSITSLCKRGILLNNGRIVVDSTAVNAVQQYYMENSSFLGEINDFQNSEKPGDDIASILNAKIINSRGIVATEYDIHEDIIIEFEYYVAKKNQKLNPNINLYNIQGARIIISIDSVLDPDGNLKKETGVYKARCIIPGNLLNDGSYYLDILLHTLETNSCHFVIRDALRFTIVDTMAETITRGDYRGEWVALIRPALKWECDKIK